MCKNMSQSQTPHTLGVHGFPPVCSARPAVPHHDALAPRPDQVPDGGRLLQRTPPRVSLDHKQLFEGMVARMSEVLPARNAYLLFVLHVLFKLKQSACAFFLAPPPLVPRTGRYQPCYRHAVGASLALAGAEVRLRVSHRSACRGARFLRRAACATLPSCCTT